MFGKRAGNITRVVTAVAAGVVAGCQHVGSGRVTSWEYQPCNYYILCWLRVVGTKYSVVDVARAAALHHRSELACRAAKRSARIEFNSHSACSAEGS